MKTLALLSLAAIFYGCTGGGETTITAAVAANVAGAFEEIGNRFQERSEVRVSFNVASSGQLAHQIVNGAPVDFFASANVGYVEEVEREGLVRAGTKAVYAEGRLTLWIPRGRELDVQGVADLAMPQVERIGMANPEHAPYGVAAREALVRAGVWEQVQPKTVIGENANQTMHYGTSGNVDVAIVPLSLSLEEAERGRYVRVSEGLYTPIRQAMAVIEGSANEEEAMEFWEFVKGPVGRGVLKEFGYDVPE